MKRKKKSKKKNLLSQKLHPSAILEYENNKEFVRTKTRENLKWEIFFTYGEFFVNEYFHDRNRSVG